MANSKIILFSDDGPLNVFFFLLFQCIITLTERAWELTSDSGYYNSFINVMITMVYARVISESERAAYREQPSGVPAGILRINA